MWSATLFKDSSTFNYTSSDVLLGASVLSRSCSKECFALTLVFLSIFYQLSKRGACFISRCLVKRQLSCVALQASFQVKMFQPRPDNQFSSVKLLSAVCHKPLICVWSEWAEITMYDFKQTEQVGWCQSSVLCPKQRSCKSMIVLLFGQTIVLACARS